MNVPIVLPPPTEVAERLRDLRREMDATKRLLKVSKVAYEAQELREARAGKPEEGAP